MDPSLGCTHLFHVLGTVNLIQRKNAMKIIASTPLKVHTTLIVGQGVRRLARQQLPPTFTSWSMRRALPLALTKRE